MHGSRFSSRLWRGTFFSPRFCFLILTGLRHRLANPRHLKRFLRPHLQTLARKRNRWYVGPDRDTTKEQREQTRALQKEQTELIKELLGKNVYQAMQEESGSPDYMERQFGKLTDEQREKVQEMQQRFSEAQSEI